MFANLLVMPNNNNNNNNKHPILPYICQGVYESMKVVHPTRPTSWSCWSVQFYSCNSYSGSRQRRCRLDVGSPLGNDIHVTTAPSHDCDASTTPAHIAIRPLDPRLFAMPGSTFTSHVNLNAPLSSRLSCCVSSLNLGPIMLHQDFTRACPSFSIRQG